MTSAERANYGAAKRWTALRSTVIKFAVSALLIYLLLRGGRFHALIANISTVDRTMLAVAAVCYATAAIPSAVRWSMVISALGHTLKFWRVLSILLIGYFFNLTLVSSVGGDGVRMWRAYRAGLPAAVAASSVLIERLAQVLAHLLIVLASLPILFYRVPDTLLRLAIVLLLVVGLAGFAFLMMLDLMPAPLQRFRIFGASARFAKDLRHILLARRTAIPTLLLGLVNQMTVVIVVRILAAGLHLSIGFADCLIIVPSAMLLTAIPVSIAGWGVREGAFVVGFSYVGLGSTDALTLSVLFGVLNLVVRLPGVLVWLLVPDDTSRARSSPGSPCLDHPPQ